MGDRRKKTPGNPLSHLPEISDTVSFNECTGLMPTPPQTPEQWEAYKKLFSVELPETDVWHKS